MMLLKVFGCEFDTAFGNLYVEVPPLGELYVEREAHVRGRWWFDYMAEGRTLQFFVGKTHIILCRSRNATSDQSEMPVA